MIARQVAALLLAFVSVAWSSPAWGQSAKPDPVSKRALTRAEQKLLDEFNRTYVLGDGEAVKHFAPPFLPGRIIYYHHSQPAALIRSEAEGPDSFFFRWRRNGLDCVSGAVFGVGGLLDLIPILLDFDRHEIEGDEKLLKLPIRGDWILRDGVSDEKLLAAMEEVLQEQLQIPVEISVQELDREVLLANGDFCFTPMGDSKRVEIYGDSLVKKGGGGGSGDLAELLRGASRFIGQRVVSNVENPPKARLSWHYNGPMQLGKMAEKDVEQVLKHLTEQTGLTFSEGIRRVRVLVVERAE